MCPYNSKEKRKRRREATLEASLRRVLLTESRPNYSGDPAPFGWPEARTSRSELAANQGRCKLIASASATSLSRTASGIGSIPTLKSTTTSVSNSPRNAPLPSCHPSLLSVKATRCSGILWLVRLGGLAGRLPMPRGPSQPRPSGMLRSSSRLVSKSRPPRPIEPRRQADMICRRKEGFD
jgi:hypothetical protein